MANNQLLASDNFASGSLAAGWSPYPTLSTCQVVVGSPNVTEINVVGTGAGQIWTGLTWPNDQVSEVTIQSLPPNANAGTITLSVRINLTNGANGSGYLAVVNSGATANTGVLTVYRLDNGVTTALSSTVTALSFVAGDVMTFYAAGSGLFVYKNGKRIFYFNDATYASGSPGYNQNVVAGGSLTGSQISAWRGYSVVQQDGIWKKQSVVLPAIAADFALSAGQGIQTSAVRLEGNAQILSGTVFKMWPWNNVAGHTYYAESSDGVNWTRRGTPVLSNFLNSTIFKNGLTYYLYAQASAANGTGDIQVFTSSDGIVWAQQTPSNVISLGTAGAWDSTNLYPFIVAGIVNGTWYGLYPATKTGTNFLFSTGLVTSTDGINWTKYAGNPVLPNVLDAGAIARVNGVWYMWTSANQPGQGHPVAPNLDPTEIVRYQSTDLITWTNAVHSVHRAQPFESLNANTGQVWPASIINFNGKAYFFLNTGPGDNTPPSIAQIELAIGPAPLESIALQKEDAAQQIATDSFTSGIGDLSANWTTPSGATKLQIISGNLCEATSSNTICAMAYTGAAFSSNQYSDITLTTLLDQNQFISPIVRAQTAASSWYTLNLNGPLTSADTTFQLIRRIAGVNTLIGPVVQVTPKVGDVFRLSVITGSDGFPVLSAYQNGFLILQFQDYSNSLTSGFPGLLVFAQTTLTSAQVSSWAGGNANVIPAYVYSYPDDRAFGHFPNLSVTNQGTLLYTVQNPDCRVASIIPVDSRAASIVSVDSRASIDIPFNSRNTPS